MESILDDLGVNSNVIRWKKIKKGLVFLDFRLEISVFDRCMYYFDFKLRKKKSGVLIIK